MAKAYVEIAGKQTVSGPVKEAANAFRDFKTSVEVVAHSFQSLDYAKKALQALIQVASACVKEWAENERATLAFNAAVEQSTQLTAGAGGRLKEFAQSIASVTGETGRSVEALITFLDTSGRTEEQITRIISVATSMSVATGMSLETSVRNLAKTFGGLTGELGESMPELKAFTKEQLQAGAAVDALEKKYGNLAAALEDSSDVSIKNYQNAMANARSEIGRMIDFGIKPLRNALTGMIGDWAEAQKAVNDYIDAQARIEKGKGTLLDQLVVAQRDLAREEQNKQFIIGDRNPAQLEGTMREQYLNIQAKIEAQEALVLSLQTQLALSGAQRADAATQAAANAQAAADAQAAAVALVKNNYAQLSAFLETLNRGQREADFNNDSNEDQYRRLRAMLFQFQELTNGMQLGPQGAALSAEIAARLQAGIEEAARAINAGRGSAPASNLADEASNLADEASQADALMDIMVQAAMSFDAVRALMDPVSVIMKAFVDTLAPVVDQVLAPSIGILVIIGQTLGKLLVPALQILTPILSLVATGFAWLYNNAIAPFANGLISMFVYLQNALSRFVEWITFGAIRIAQIKLDDVLLDSIDLSDINNAGTDYLGGSTSSSGSSASYSQVRDVTVNVSIETSALVGNDGIAEFSQIIARQLRSSGVLGYA